MKKKILLTICLTLLLTLLIGFAAEAYTIPDEYRPQNVGFGKEYFENTESATAAVIVLQTIAGALLYFAAPLAVILIGFSAFNMVMGGADSEKLEQSKKHLTWTVIGLLVIILSYTIVKMVIGFVSKSADQEALPATTSSIFTLLA